MNDKVYIERREKQDNLYQLLQDRSLEKLQQLSGTRWTDFNEHDPGITLLDVFNYALLELDYHLGSPLESYLTFPGKESFRYEEKGLIAPEELFEAVVVTPSDYETLIISHFEKEISACHIKIDKQAQYTILIQLRPEFQSNKEQICRDVKALYHRYRNLCENLLEVRAEHIPKNLLREENRNKDLPVFEIPQPVCEGFNPLQTPIGPIANDLPPCYGVGEEGLPSDAGVERRAKALQLKAYMQVFDYLLSGVRQQAAQTGQLLELSAKLPPAFNTQFPQKDLTKLLDKEKVAQAEILDADETSRQKDVFFDHLDLLYGEDTRTFAKGRTQAFRASLIRQMLELNAIRFRSFNLLDTQFETMPGIKHFVHAVLGNGVKREQSMTNLFSRYNLRLVSDERFFDDLYGVFSVEFLISEIPGQWKEVVAVPRIPVEENIRKDYRLRNHLNLFRHNVLFEGFLRHGMKPDCFRSVTLRDGSGYLLVYKQPGRNEWINLGFFFELQMLIRTCNRLWTFIEMLNRESFSFYFVEHILLLDESGMPMGPPNRLTIFVPRWIDYLYEKDTYLDIFAERLPAHIEVFCTWLPVDEMKEFENAYYHWRMAWATGDEAGVAKRSGEIREYVNN